MRKLTTASMAIVAVLAAGSGAMAQSWTTPGDWRAASPRANFNYSNPMDAYDLSDGYLPFGGARPWGSARNSSSQSNYNPALDRAKGSMW
jgi:hypothetical protein